MNKIIENFLDIHKKEYSIERLDTETAFEHFTNKCIVNKYSNERFDPSDIMTDPGEKGLDGVAICVNGRVITSNDELESILGEAKSLDVRFVLYKQKPVNISMEMKLELLFMGLKLFLRLKPSVPKQTKRWII